MKATTIIRTAGLTILMGLTLGTIANAQRSTRDDVNQKRSKPVKFEVNDKNVNKNNPTKVYSPANEPKGKYSNKQDKHNGYKAKKANSESYSHANNWKKNYKTGSNYSSWNYDYNGYPVHNNRYANKYYHANVNHRLPHLTVELPRGFFGLTLDGVRYFHNNGVFYTRHPRGGYVAVAPPTYFRHIPAGSVKIRIDGRVYFQYRNLIFKHTVYGFKMV